MSRIPLSGARRPTTHEAIRTLVSGEDAGVLSALAEAAAVEDQFLRRTAIEVIGCHSHGRELCTIIMSALGDPSEYVVRAACEVVAQWKFREAHTLVAALLVDASKATRQAAIRALDTIWIDADFSLIFRIYTSASEIGVQRDAAWVLRRRVSPAHWRTLFDAFYLDELPDTDNGLASLQTALRARMSYRRCHSFLWTLTVTFERRRRKRSEPF